MKIKLLLSFGGMLKYDVMKELLIDLNGTIIWSHRVIQAENIFINAIASGK